jgi:hypothetical protein
MVKYGLNFGLTWLVPRLALSPDRGENVRRFYQMALASASVISFVLTVWAVIYLTEAGLLRQVLLPWYLFGYAVWAIFSIVMYRKHDQGRATLILHLGLSLFYALFWVSFLLEWANQSHENRSHDTNDIPYNANGRGTR